MKNQEPKPLPPFFVGRSIVSKRVANYQQNKHTLLSQAMGKEETKSIWYSKAHIAKLLEEIELVDGDGLRFYMGAYEPDHATFANQLCILMVVTKTESTATGTIQKNIFLEDREDFAQRSSLQRNISSANDPSSIFDEKGRDFNFGSPCPPICDGGLGCNP